MSEVSIDLPTSRFMPRQQVLGKKKGKEKGTGIKWDAPRISLRPLIYPTSTGGHAQLESLVRLPLLRWWSFCKTHSRMRSA